MASNSGRVLLFLRVLCRQTSRLSCCMSGSGTGFYGSAQRLAERCAVQLSSGGLREPTRFLLVLVVVHGSR
eukprot:6456657-Amphidinium_carterae.1